MTFNEALLVYLPKMMDTCHTPQSKNLEELSHKTRSYFIHNMAVTMYVLLSVVFINKCKCGVYKQ